MQLLDQFRSQLPPDAPDGFVVRHCSSADARKVAIDEVRAHLPDQDPITPVANVFEQQEAQRHIGGSGWAPSCLTLANALGQLLLHEIQQLFVPEQLIHLAHPGLEQITDFIGDEAVGEAELESMMQDQADLLPDFVSLPVVAFEDDQLLRNRSRLSAAIWQPVSQKSAQEV